MNDAETRPQGEPHWRQLYKAALIEVDLNLLPERIAEAQNAMAERAVTLLRERGHHHSEKKALADAHVLLDDLKRIHQTDGASSHQAREKRLA